MQQKMYVFLIQCWNDSVKRLQKLLFPSGSLLSDVWLCWKKWDPSYLLNLIIKCPQTSSSSGSTSSASTGLCVMTALCQARRSVWLLNLTPWRAALQVDQSQRAHDEKICSEEIKRRKCVLLLESGIKPPERDSGVLSCICAWEVTDLFGLCSWLVCDDCREVAFINLAIFDLSKLL